MRQPFLLFVLAIGACLPGHAGAQVTPEEKRYAVEMRGLPWRQVFEWLSDQSGLPMSTKYPPPPGTFTLITPNKGKEAAAYTLTEMIDLINDTLALQGHLLVRRNASITLVVDDEKIDAGLAPHIEAAELKSRGRTELVSIAVPLDHFGNAEAAREVRKLMGRFGEVVVLTEPKRVVLRDTTENLQRILALTARVKTGPAQPKKAIEPAPAKKGPGERKAIALNYVRFVAIAKTKNGNEATLRDFARGKDYTLRAAPGFAEIRVRDLEDANKYVFNAEVVRIDARELYFRANNQTYRLRIGDPLSSALETPLTKDELKELGLDR